MNISNSNTTEDAAFKKNENYGHYEANYRCYNGNKTTVPCKNAYESMTFTISTADPSSISAKDLKSYMNKLIDIMEILDRIWCAFMGLITKQLDHYYHSNEMPSNYTISLFVYDLQTMPNERELLEVLSSLLSWV